MNAKGTTSSALRRAATVAVVDGFGLAGAGSTVYGVHLIHAPSAFLVAGAMLMGFALAAARKIA